jgi:hypothetical protein
MLEGQEVIGRVVDDILHIKERTNRLGRSAECPSGRDRRVWFCR